MTPPPQKGNCYSGNLSSKAPSSGRPSSTPDTLNSPCSSTAAPATLHPLQPHQVRCTASSLGQEQLMNRDHLLMPNGKRHWTGCQWTIASESFEELLKVQSPAPQKDRRRTSGFQTHQGLSKSDCPILESDSGDDGTTLWIYFFIYFLFYFIFWIFFLNHCIIHLKSVSFKDFSGSPMVRTPCLHCRAPGFHL